MQLSDILAQGDKIDALLARVDKIMATRREAYDRVYHSLQASYTFVQGENTTQDLALNVPDGNDFEATRLMLYPELRCIATDTSVQGPDDKTFRSTGWFSDYVFGLNGFVNTSIDALVNISYRTADKMSRPYSNTPWFAAGCFSLLCNSCGDPTTDFWGSFWNRSETPGGLVFDPFFLLESGASMVISITPTYSGLRQTSGQDGRLYEYRLRAVLEGYKRVRK